MEREDEIVVVEVVVAKHSYARTQQSIEEQTPVDEGVRVHNVHK